MTLDTPVSTLAGETMQEAIPRFLERERRGHEAFARTRRRAYVENRGVLDRLDRYAAVSPGDAGRSLPLVVTGDSGAGKSALLAHWSERYRLDNPDRFIITHYVGATADSGDYAALLRRIMLEIRERTGTIAEPPDDPDDLIQRFPEWLSYVRDESIVVVIDAVNQLEEKLDEFPPLHWLPGDFPAHVRLIVSTLDGPLRRVMEARGWGMLTVEPLGEKERHEVARRFLGGGAGLDSTQVRRLTQNRNSANPLYLRTSLEELRRVGGSEKPTEAVDRYLDAADLDTLFDRVLERIESEYGVRLVSAIMRFLWGSRQGLNRDELLALSGVKSPRLGRLIGSLDYQLMERDGLLTFFHDHLRSAVRKRYVAGDRASRAIHRRLGAYFAARPVDRRRADEELWQWRHACAWDDLRHGLTDFPLFSYLYQGEKKHEVLRYWQAIPEKERRSMEEEYAGTLRAIEESTTMTPLEKAEGLEKVAAFLTESAEHAEAERLYREALTIREQIGGAPDRARVRTLTQLGTVLSTRGQFAEAEEKLREALRLIEELAGPDSSETAEVVDALATLLYSFRNYRDAEPLYRRALAIRERALGRRHPDTIMSLANLGAAYFALDQAEQAHHLFTTALELSEEALGSDHPHTSTHLNNLALSLGRQERHHESIALLERAIDINTRIYGARHPEVASHMVNLAVANHDAGRMDDADNYYRGATEILSDVYGPIHPEVARLLVNYGTFLLQGRADPESAEQIYRRAIAIRTEVFPHDHVSIHDCWLNVALILMERGEAEASIDIYQRSLPVVESHLGNDNRRVERMYARYLQLLRETGRNEEMERIMKRMDS